MHKTNYYIQKENNKVQCELCPHYCLLAHKETGQCHVRQNQKGALYDIGYGRISSLAIDPVEKKPLYHFYPGTSILSTGGFGCNFTCNFCQNYTISQIQETMLTKAEYLSHESIVKTAREKKPKAGIAFTYNEPIVNYDFVLNTAHLAQKHNIPTAMVSNGFINPKPLTDLLNVINAFNIDLKAFSDNFYKQYTGGRLKPVLKNLKEISKAGNHLEITHLVITDTNDQEQKFKEMISWIADNLGVEVPLHISRYFPMYKSQNHATHTGTIETFVEIAREKLSFVYPGNILTDGSTYCPKCGTRVISRTGNQTKITALSGTKCSQCNYELPIKI